MTEQYRKLTDVEIKALYNLIAGRFAKPTQLQEQITEHVKRYYPKAACSAVLTVQSEYNDETYDNSAGCLVVYDADGAEVVPNTKTARASRDEWRNFDVPSSSSEEAQGDIVVHLATQPIPDLYVKKD